MIQSLTSKAKLLLFYFIIKKKIDVSFEITGQFISIFYLLTIWYTRYMADGVSAKVIYK